MVHTLGSAIPGESFVFGDTEVTIQDKCGGNLGQWICVNHGERFGNNFQKDTHISEGVHVLAWNCFDHGPEAP